MTTWSFLREVATKTKARGGIFKSLRMNFGSQVSPLITPFPDVERRNHNQLNPHGQEGEQEKGPGRPYLPWNRKRHTSELLITR